MSDSTPLQMLVHPQEGSGDQANWGLQPATAGGGGGDPSLPGPNSPFFCPTNSKLLQKLILITFIIMKLRPEPLSLLLVLFSQQLTKSPSLSEFNVLHHFTNQSWHQSPEVIPATLWSDVVSGILRPQESLWIIRFAVQEKSLEYYMHIVMTQMWNPCWIQDRTVNHIVSHAEFNPRNLGNTIALLFVENNFELADHIDTICLPAYQVLSWSSCIISIWSSPLTTSVSPGELWAEQGLLCEGLGQGCLWQGGRVSGDLPKVCPPMIILVF